MDHVSFHFYSESAFEDLLCVKLMIKLHFRQTSTLEFKYYRSSYRRISFLFIMAPPLD